MIFISYSHRDSDRVHPLIERMISDGFEVWYDEGIDPGTEWDENIAMHLKQCSGIIAFLSDNYLASDNCRDELNYARDLGKERLLVYLESVELPAGMAMRLNRIQAIHKYKYKSEDAFYSELTKAPMLKNLMYADEEEIEEIPDPEKGPVSKREFIKKPALKNLATFILVSTIAVFVISPMMMLFGDYYAAPVIVILTVAGYIKMNRWFVLPAAAIAFLLGCIMLPYYFIIFVFLLLLFMGFSEADRSYRKYLSTGVISRYEPFWRLKDR